MSQRSLIPKKEIHANLGLFNVRVSLARMLFMHKLYLKALNTHGIIMEFGVRRGQNMALFTTFRSLYGPTASAGRSSASIPLKDSLASIRKMGHLRLPRSAHSR